MKSYTMIGGVNGVGKSSLSGVLCRQLTDMGNIIDPDNIAAQEKVRPLDCRKNCN